MRIILEQKHQDIINASGHLLVTGGPGSGKTTIALLKAQQRCQTLKPGQEVLFLSFSRAAVKQILTRCKDILRPAEQKNIQVRTYHSFCIEVLEAHGRLLCGRPVCFLYPSDERLIKSGFDGDWEVERSRLSVEEGRYCFDLVASATALLFERSSAVRTLYASTHPLIIVDEFQDTDDDQWRIIKALTELTDVFCLADPDQCIFEYRENVDPKRIEKLRNHIRPTEFDLGGDNHRSPRSGILQFADAVLHNRNPLPNFPEITIHHYYPNVFHSTVHAGVFWTYHQLKKEGIERPSIAILCRSNTFVAQISALLLETHQFRNQTLLPVDHDIMWDAELSAAAAQIVGSILEWPVKKYQTAIQDTLRLIAHYYRIKNSESPSKAATNNARKFDAAADAVGNYKMPRINAAKELLKLARNGLNLTGDTVEDWRQARQILKAIKSLNELFREARMVRLFRTTDALGGGLNDLWLKSGNYNGATDLVKRILDREHLLTDERIPKGFVLMTMHKVKGKEYDGVVLIEGAFSSQFFDTRHEEPPYQWSRRLLRVAITRARSHVRMIRPQDAMPLTGNYT